MHIRRVTIRRKFNINNTKKEDKKKHTKNTIHTNTNSYNHAQHNIKTNNANLKKQGN